MLQIAIECASHPQVEACRCVRTQFPQSVDLVLHDVGRSALLALRERGDDCILLLPFKHITELHIILVLQLSQTEIGQIAMRLFAQTGRIAQGVERVAGRIQVVFVLS